MTTVIRVHPQTGAYGAYGDSAALQAQNQVALVQQQLQNERDTSSLKLQYERALWQEKLKESQLQSAVQYGAAGTTGYGAAGLATAIPVSSLFGAGIGSGLVAAQPLAQAVPLGYGGGYGASGSGQTNLTNQTSTGAASQTVSNSNSYASTVSAPQYGAAWGASPYGGYGATPYGGYGYNQGGFVSNLLRGLF